MGLWVSLVFALLPLLTVRRITPLSALRRPYEPARFSWDRWSVLAGLLLGAQRRGSGRAPGGKLAQRGHVLRRDRSGAHDTLGCRVGTHSRDAPLAPVRLAVCVETGPGEPASPGESNGDTGPGDWIRRLPAGHPLSRPVQSPPPAQCDGRPRTPKPGVVRHSARSTLGRAAGPGGIGIARRSRRPRSCRCGSFRSKDARSLSCLPPRRAKAGDGPSNAWVFRREYRSTYRDSVVGSERVVAGEWSRTSESPPRISVERDLAAELGVASATKSSGTCRVFRSPPG